MHLTAAFFLALAYAETRGELNPDMAPGRDGKSFGRYQITDVYREDINRIYGTTFTRDDCYNPQLSEQMVELYMEHYCTQSRLGHVPTYEDAARIHNGGPNGWKAEKTKEYARIFNEGLEKATGARAGRVSAAMLLL